MDFCSDPCHLTELICRIAVKDTRDLGLLGGPSKKRRGGGGVGAAKRGYVKTGLDDESEGGEVFN